MSLLSQASLVVVPSGYKEDVVYSVKPTDGSGDLTFTRASDGTRVNSQGLVERVPWNLLQQSNTFNTTWAALNGGAVTGGQAGYDGTNNAWLLSKTASGGFIYQTANSFNGQYTISIYAKANASTFIRLNGNAITDSSAFFNLSTGTVHTYTNCVAQIDSVGSGWYKCSITSTDALLDYVNIYPAEITGISATTGSVYIQDAQLNEGTLKPYFPTTDRQNVPRLDYSGGCPSLLLEPQRTNLVTYSEQFDDSAWVKSNCAATANQTTSPDGTINADLITTTSTSHALFQGLTVTASTAYTFSFYVKRGTMTNLFYRVYDLTNLSDIISPTSYYSQTTESGWARVTVSFTTPTGCTSARVYPLSNSGVTGTVYFWGAQTEAGSYPTSYIPTTSASVTRVADAAYKTGISSLIGQSEGTMFAEFEWDGIDKDRMFIALTDGTSSNRMHCGYDETNNRFYFNLRSGNVQQALIVLNNPTAGRYKIAGAYKQNDVALYINGTQIGVNTSTLVAATSQLNVGGYITSGFEYSVNQAVLFTTRLTNAELAALTTL